MHVIMVPPRSKSPSYAYVPSAVEDEIESAMPFYELLFENRMKLSFLTQ